MVCVVFDELKSKYSNALQNISGTSCGVRCSGRLRSRPSHVCLPHCCTRWYRTSTLDKRSPIC
ncbi:hypothetical protein NP493_2133g00001 [Ridgeia piscesae]|uniref:Uncharacterized protein n=1 Tax=Ridgeia piscesae TaxID=27915 RepID=A0AAD9JLV8_RIDPI|nr:hypothetical protein NP493_2133g00001 [Ridgeia piscesae]